MTARPPAKSALALVPPPAPAGAAPAKRTLGEHIASVEWIADQVELLGDETLDDARRDALAAALIAELAGTRAKTDRVSATLAMFESMAAAAAAEKVRLAKRETWFSAAHERLAGYCLAVMEASGLDKLEGETSTLQRRRNPPRVHIDCEQSIPWAFFRLPVPAPEPEAAPDKKAIAEALKADPASVPGARLVQSARLVRS